MTRRQLRSLAVASALALTSLAAASTAAAAPVAAAAKTCDIRGAEATFGPTSVSSLSVTGVSCDEGKKVVRAYYRCRTANGVSGRCVRKVRGLACREQRTTVGNQFDASVTCTKRGVSVRHRYSQTIA